jgi:hypothetical protein
MVFAFRLVSLALTAVAVIPVNEPVLVVALVSAVLLALQANQYCVFALLAITFPCGVAPGVLIAAADSRTMSSMKRRPDHFDPAVCGFAGYCVRIPLFSRASQVDEIWRSGCVGGDA